MELIAVGLSTAVGVALASVEFLSLAGDTHVEFVTDIFSFAIVVSSALSEVVVVLAAWDAKVELVALETLLANWLILAKEG